MHRHEINTDGSVDSIGTCSLDVNAETADFSDTSSSLNFVAEIENKYNKQGAIYRQKEDDEERNLEPVEEDDKYYKHFQVLAADTEPVKKPSYLNLACCVNGYSSLTTYDSIFRKNLNKKPTVIATTREPLRSNFLPFHLSNNKPKMEQSIDTTDKSNNTTSTKFDLITKVDTKVVTKTTVVKKSMVQQRVERLYGSDALEQGIYSPKQTSKTSVYTHNERISNGVVGAITEDNSYDLPVFRHLRPEFRAQLHVSISPKKEANKTATSALNPLNNNYNNINNNTTSNNNHKLNNNFLSSNTNQNGVTGPEIIKPSPVIVTIPVIRNYIEENDEDENKKMNGSSGSTCSKSSETTMKITNTNGTTPTSTTQNNQKIKDGNYFLEIVEAEQNRLLNLAKNLENELDDLTAKGDLCEDVSGEIRSTAGKARLLVNQKLKQFKGLCHNNLNGRPEEKFHTTNGDLQGFWDMVYMQVEHIDLLFKDIDELRANNWVKLEKKQPQSNGSSMVKKSTIQKSTNKTPASQSATNGGSEKNKSAAVSAAAQRREQQRKQMLEMKRRNKIAMQAAAADKSELTENPIEILVNKNCI